jgi:hypothetical protein
MGFCLWMQALLIDNIGACHPTASRPDSSRIRSLLLQLRMEDHLKYQGLVPI